MFEAVEKGKHRYGSGSNISNAFEESKHPRDSDGEFASGGGAAGGGSSPDLNKDFQSIRPLTTEKVDVTKMVEEYIKRRTETYPDSSKVTASEKRRLAVILLHRAGHRVESERLETKYKRQDTTARNKELKATMSPEDFFHLRHGRGDKPFIYKGQIYMPLDKNRPK